MNAQYFDLKEWGYAIQKNERVLKIVAVTKLVSSAPTSVVGLFLLLSLSSFSLISGPAVMLFFMMLGTLVIFQLIRFFFPSKNSGKLLSFTIDKTAQSFIIERKGGGESSVSFSSFKNFSIHNSEIFTDANPFSDSNKLYTKKLCLNTDKIKIPLLSFSHENEKSLHFVIALKTELEKFLTK